MLTIRVTFAYLEHGFSKLKFKKKSYIRSILSQQRLNVLNC